MAEVRTGDRLSVLLVDDDAAIARMYLLGLESAGFQVTTAGSGRAALAAIANRLPDIAVVDWDLPGMRGDELVERLREDERTRSLPVVFLSNFPRSVTKIAAVVTAAGVMPWLVKSETTPAELAARLSLAVDGARPTPSGAA